MALAPLWPAPKTHADAPALADCLGVSTLCATLLMNRGIMDPAQARRFLLPQSISELPPLEETDWLLARLRQAVTDGDAVAVWGDYDVDGLTGGSLLLDFFRRRGLTALAYNPHRLQEGYGLNVPGLQSLKDQGVGLVFTVDCGISNVAEIAAAKAMGLDVVITDHHDLPAVLPPAVRIINHKLGDNALLKQLAGVGVAYQLACSLMPLWPADDCPEDYLDLLAVGTIADVAPLQGFNRDLVRAGLEALHVTRRPGLHALKAVSNLGDRTPTATDVAFRIGPRINAVGRMAHPSLALKLLLSTDLAEAEAIAVQVNELNVERQAVVSRIQAEAEAMVADQVDLDQCAVIALCDPGWHHGVIGIVCSRLVEQFGRPVFLGCVEGDQVRGSARSPGSLSISEALQSTARHLLKFGGHAPAGGFSLALAEWEAWRDALLAYGADRLNVAALRPVLPIEAAPDLAVVSMATYEEIVSMAPFGAKNPEPVMAAWGARVVDQKTFGKGGEHRRITLRAGDETIETILWRGADTPLPERVDLAYRLEHNEWRGQSSLRLNLQAWRPHQGPDVVDLDTVGPFEEAGHADHLSMQAVPVTASLAAQTVAAATRQETLPPLTAEPAPDAAVAGAGFGPSVPAAAQADDGDVLPWSLSVLLAHRPYLGSLVLPDGTDLGLPALPQPNVLANVTVVDRRDPAGPTEGDGSLRDIMTFRNKGVTDAGGSSAGAGTLALGGLPEDGPTLRALVGACDTRRLLLCFTPPAAPEGVSADWLHRLKSLLDEPDPFRAAWSRLQSPPSLVWWGLRLLADVGEIIETDGVTRRGRVRGGSLLFQLPHYGGYRRWADRRQAYWRLFTAGTAADMAFWLNEGTSDDD